MIKVLDAHALMIYLEKEPGYEKILDLFINLSQSDKKAFMTSVNWGEVYYITMREKGQSEAEQIIKIIDTFPIEVVQVDKILAKQAAAYKATKKMSYADCFASALAKLKKAELLTGDKEFKAVEGEIKILWIREKQI